MRVAVLSDIHSNIEAFQAVVSDLEHRTDRILNLGDLVGYNASPNECVELASDIGMHSIQGNHDQAACNLCGQTVVIADPHVGLPVIVLYRVTDQRHSEHLSFER